MFSRAALALLKRDLSLSLSRGGGPIFWSSTAIPRRTSGTRAGSPCSLSMVRWWIGMGC